MNNINKILASVIFNTDSYKTSHWVQYPPETENIYSYIEARKSSNPGVSDIVHFGVQSYIRESLLTPITQDDVRCAAAFCEAHGVPFNLDGWEYIVEKHNGYLPLTICSVPEGTPVPIGHPTVTVTSTDPKCFWLVSYIETDLLQNVWYGSTVATLSREIKKVIWENLCETSDDPSAEIGFKLHDFGFRGVSSRESAGIGGAAHLVNFMGTDTIPGIIHAMKYYDSDVCGFSIPASEHSTMTSWGQDNEFLAYKNMVIQYAKPGAIFACVIDSYDIINALRLWAVCQTGEEKSLLDQVKEAGATVVLRPDSGDPVQTPIEVIDWLMYNVGYTENSKGFGVLPSHVRVIQGDGIEIDDVREILDGLKANKISGSNIAFGMGGGLLQKVNRDTFGFAMKCSAAKVNGEWRDVYKSPKGSPSKASKRGLVEVRISKDPETGTTYWENAKVGGPYTTKDNAIQPVYFFFDEMATPFIKTITFDEVRRNASDLGIKNIVVTKD